MIPAFVRNVHASYVSEATSGVNTLATRAAALVGAAQASSGLPDDAPLTPAQVPRGSREVDPPGTWDHPTWRALEFSFESAHSYSFRFESEKTPDQATWTARAHGDLDGDGTLSQLSLGGVFRPGSAPVLSDLDVQNEIE